MPYSLTVILRLEETQLTSRCNYRPQRSCEGYVFTPVCLSTGGVCLSACSDTTPGSRHPLKGPFGSFPFTAVKIVKSISDLVEFKTLIKKTISEEVQIDLHDP